MPSDEMCGTAGTVSEMIDLLESIEEEYGDIAIKHREGMVLGRPYLNHFPETSTSEEHVEVTSL